MTTTVRPVPAARSGPERQRRDPLPWAVLCWAVGYGAVRLHWTLGGPPAFGPLGTDLMVFTGWASVGLCASAVVLATGLAAARCWCRPLAVAGAAVGAALVLSCPLLLLDLVAPLIPGLGLPFHLGALVSRAVCLTGAVLLVAAVREHWRRYRADCRRCGRSGTVSDPGDLDRVPGWARWAAYAAVAGCLVRLVSQLAVGLDDVPLRQGAAMVAFEVGFLLAGVLLPLALVHRWGRVWPRWVPLLAGRRVPRWLLLVPGAAVGGGLTVYFGLGTGQLAVQTVSGTWSDQGGALPLGFFWVAMPAYLIWGVGLAVATIAYQRRTRRPCRRCGR